MSVTKVATQAPLDFVAPEYQMALAKEWGQAHGYFAAAGGWVYRADSQEEATEESQKAYRTGRRSRRSVTQGWMSFWTWKKYAILDWLTVRLTAARSFAEFTHPTANGRTYRPTLLVPDGKAWRTDALASAYDGAMRKQGDPRRAYRGFGRDLSKLEALRADIRRSGAR